MQSQKLLEYYTERLKAVVELINDLRFKDDANPDYIRLKTKANCYREIISDVMNSKINESISVKDRLNKIERIKKEYGSESNQYIIIALNEITSILRDYFNVDEIEDDGPGGV